MKLQHRKPMLVCLCALFLLTQVIAPAAETAKKAPAASGASPSGEMTVYVGTYSSGPGKGIFAYGLDMASGKLTAAGTAEVKSPAFLAIHPNGKFLYALSEGSDSEGKPVGGVSALAIGPGGKLTVLNSQSSGGGAAHLVVDHQGKNVLVANYGGGSVAVLPIGADGKLAPISSLAQHKGSSVNPARQEAPHAHGLSLDRAGRFAFVADLGLDKVMVYRLDSAKGTITANDPPFATIDSGSGPRHVAFTPSGTSAYVINELSSTLTAFMYDPARGVLQKIQTISTLPKDFKGENTTAEVEVHPSGKFLYGSNRGHNSIAIFAIDEHTGKLTPIGHESTGGKTPRSFGVDPTGTFLLAANQDTNNVVVLRIDPKTGQLKPTGNVVDVPSPVCVQFLALTK